jgi:predicted P-loop ATPase
MSRQSFEEVVHLVAMNNAFDSAQEWLRGVPVWDGIPRIDRFLPDYLGTLDRPYELAVGRYWWTAMVARILYPGCRADMVPILVGPQGVGKSTVLEAIAPIPQHCGEACLSDRSSLLSRKVHAKILVVWEEMRGIASKPDADEVKTFITSPYVEISKRTQDGMARHLRRFILVGTANGKEILRDPTGHRRYLPFDVPRKIDVTKVLTDHEQLWAEALHMVSDRLAMGEGPVDYQDAELLAKKEHSAYVKEGRWVGEKSLLNWLQRKPAAFTAEEALSEIGFRPEQITQREKREMAETLRQLGVKQGVHRIPGHKNPLTRWIAI